MPATRDNTVNAGRAPDYNNIAGAILTYNLPSPLASRFLPAPPHAWRCSRSRIGDCR